MAAFLAPLICLPLLLPQGVSSEAPNLDAEAWLNTETPLASWKEDLRGQVVLLDFWTYCCINCLHILPDLAQLERDFAEEPFLVIGVHSKKFDQEAEVENIRQAILRHKIKHPVAVDSSHTIWNAFGVRAWPTLILVDPTGKEVGRISGEGHYETLKKAIQAVLDEHREKNTLATRPIKPVLETSSPGPLSFPGKVFALPGSPKSILVSDTGNDRVVEVETTSGKILRSWGELNEPHGLAVIDGYLYVAETGAHRITKIAFDRDYRKVVAGTGRQASFRPKEGAGLATSLNSPWALEADGELLHIAMAGSHQLWTLNAKTGNLTHLAGSGRENIVDGPALRAQLAQPSGFALLGQKLYFADSEVSAVRMIDLENKNVQTLVGSHLFRFGDEDGIGVDALLQHPLGLATWKDSLCVADTFNGKIKILNLDSISCSSFRASSLAGEELSLWEPGGIATRGDTLFIADTNHHRVVAVDLEEKTWAVLIGPEVP